MRILVAPDSFKESMSSKEASEAIKKGIENVSDRHEVTLFPVADGGEGTVEAFLHILNGEWKEVAAEDPLGRYITARYGWIEASKTAIIEMATASGLPLLTRDERDPHRTSTHGTGQVVRHALDQGAEKIILGLGGSATVDAGSGCFEALGVKFLDESDQPISMNGENLGKVAKVDVSSMDERVRTTKWMIASDVTNPLLGEDGAVYVFGPQKGLKEEHFHSFEEAMASYADAVETSTGISCRQSEGSGAAGGFGFSLFSFLHNYEVESGFELLASFGNLEASIIDSDLVITGEGKLDRQSLYGKGPVGISNIAKQHQVPCIAFAGHVEGDDAMVEQGIISAFPITNGPMKLMEAIENGQNLLSSATTRVMRIWERK